MNLCKLQKIDKMLQNYVDNYVDKVENSVFKPRVAVDNITKMLRLIKIHFTYLLDIIFEKVYNKKCDPFSEKTKRFAP